MEASEMTYGRTRRGRLGASPGTYAANSGRMYRGQAFAVGGDDADGGRTLATALGWFSIGLGLAELTAPRSVGRLTGLGDDDDTRDIMIAAGLREIASGVGILTNTRSAGWLQTRVGGDAMDLAVLGAGLASHRSDKSRVLGSILAVIGVAALDVLATRKLSLHGTESGALPYDETIEPIGASRRGQGKSKLSSGMSSGSGIHVKKTMTINRTREEVYSFWHDFQNLPRFMRHLKSVEVTGGGRSHWTAVGPMGMSVEWDAEVTEDRPNEVIAWRSVEGADVDNAGSVRFKDAPRDQGTEVTVELRYAPPGGKVGKLIAGLFGEEPSQQVRDDLYAFKQVMEAGEVVLSDGTLRAPRLKQRAGQPPKHVPEG